MTLPDDAPRLYDYIRDYYGKRIQATGDLLAGACCTEETAARFKELLALLPDEVVSRQYGCGSPLPDDDLRGLRVVDLGSGAGADAFLAAKLVGPEGRVIGVDMTDEQLAVARTHTPAVMRAWGHDPDAPNITFHGDYIERCADVPDGWADLVISNCVINLSPRKDEVFRTVARMLKPGGELYVSDIVCDRRLPDAARQDWRMYSECLTGAQYGADLHDTLRTAGFSDVRTVSSALLEDRIEGEAARFSSVTFRGFRLDLDRRCEDYGQTATYRGTLAGSEVLWALDADHVFEAGRPAAICRNTARMLSQTRLAPHFEVSAERKHFGLFDCGPAPSGASAANGAACC